MTHQYGARRDHLGWTVFDHRTGRPAVVTRAAQTGLTWPEADDLLDRLNQRCLEATRKTFQ